MISPPPRTGRVLHRFEAGRPHWWQWPTVLSLDAPCVALAWQELLARANGGAPAGPERWILGASVWMAYAADRWIEGRRLDPAQVRTQRHWFYARWNLPVAVVWLAVFGVTVALAFTRLDRPALAAGFLLLGPVLAYLISHQLIHRQHPWRAPKELCVAVLFAAGAALFPATGPGGLSAALLAATALFGLLVFANCALIAGWEREVDRAHGQTSLVLQFPRAGTAARTLPWLLAALGAGLAAGPAFAALRPAAWCTLGSGLLLGLVDRWHHRLGRQLARVLADAALLTPWAIPLASRFLSR